MPPRCGTATFLTAFAATPVRGTSAASSHPEPASSTGDVVRLGGGDTRPRNDTEVAFAGDQLVRHQPRGRRDIEMHIEAGLLEEPLGERRVRRRLANAAEH